LGLVHERTLRIDWCPKILKRRPWLAYSITEFIRMYQEPCNLGHTGGLPAPNSLGICSVKTFISVLTYVVARSASAADRGDILRKVSRSSPNAVFSHSGLLPKGWTSVSESFPAMGHEGPMSNKLFEMV
jgi:hypothetical protein